ncbi:hypothetical protein ABZV58_30425 [Nocardia sp. NPDC004654]|uniref:hypothetical protein n=1 Tax=Nocardia sp. NPDC004654 TaxID=3154776 RepID=UPI0033AEC44B
MFDNLFRSGQGDIPDMPIPRLGSELERFEEFAVDCVDPTPLPASEDWVLIRSAS